MNQETQALVVVGLIGVLIGMSIFRRFLTKPIAQYLLKKQKVKAAFRVLSWQSKKKSCC